MAIHLELVYGKKIGLPEYSSHNFSVSLKSEVGSSDDVPAEVGRVYRLLQNAVDEQIIHPGYVPGQEIPQQPQPHSTPDLSVAWKCSPKQKELILKLVDERGLDRHDVDQKAVDRFGHGVTRLNKLEASGLIDELMGGKPQGRRGQRRAA